MAISLDSVVLVVDDFASIRAIVVTTLKEVGFTQVMEAESGGAAWSLIQDNFGKVGLIVSDLNMENGSGLELLKRVRADATHSKTPFLMMTTDSDTTTVLSAVEFGASNFLVKPFTKDVFKKKLSLVMNKA